MVTPELIAEIRKDKLLMNIIKAEWACEPYKILNPPPERKSYLLMQQVLLSIWRDRHNRRSRHKLKEEP